MNNYVTKKLPLEGNTFVARASASIVLAYLAAIASAEVAGVLIGVIPSTLFHALLILILLNHYISLNQAAYRRILPVFALAPLLRILSLIMPIKEVPQIYWYAMIGIPLLVAVTLTARLLKLSWTEIGLRLYSWRSQIFIACSGLPLSLTAFLLFRPATLITKFNWHDLVIGSVILLTFTGFTEEIIFRGLLQQVTTKIYGRVGVLCSSLLFAIMYIGSLSLSYIIFMGLTGLFFSWCVERTRSLWGVVLAHSILNIGMLLVWPLIWP
jgi:membrane protease YdiL (CAAX protease family)